MALGQFKKGAAPASKGESASKSKWIGVKPAQPRDPIIHAGEYRLRVVRSELGRTKEYLKAVFEVIDQAPGQTLHEKGDEVVVLFRMVDDAGQSRRMALFVAAAGYSDFSEFLEADKDGSLSAVTDQFERGDDSPFTGRLVDVRVRRGKDKGDGDYFREFEWMPVAEEDQSS